MGKEQELLEAAKNCTLPVVKRLINQKIKKIGSISKNNDAGYSKTKSGFSRSQESILDNFSISSPSTSHQSNSHHFQTHNKQPHHYPPHSHHHASTSYINLDPPSIPTGRDILPLTRNSKSVDSDSLLDRENSRCSSSNGDELRGGSSSSGGGGKLTIYPQSSSMNGENYGSGYENIKRNYSSGYRDDSRLDAKPATINNNNWGYNSIQRRPGNKPLPPAKPPRKSLANKDGGSMTTLDRKGLQMNEQFKQQPITTSKGHQTNSSSKRISSFDYVSDSGLSSGESCMKRSLSNDGGDYMEGRNLSNSQRLSTFLGPAKTPDSSSSSVNVSPYNVSMLPSSTSSSSSANITIASSTTTTTAINTPPTNTTTTITSNTSDVTSNSINSTDAISAVNTPITNNSSGFISESALSALYDEIASEISCQETNSSLVSSINSVTSLEPEISSTLYNTTEARRKSLKETSLLPQQQQQQQHARSKSEHHHPRCPNNNNEEPDKTIISSSSSSPNNQIAQSKPIQSSEAIKSKRATVQFPVNFKSLTRRSSKQYEPPSPETALKGINAVIEPLYQMHDNFDEACTPMHQPASLHMIWSQFDYQLLTADYDRYSNLFEIKKEYQKLKAPHYRDMETSTDDDLLLTTDSDGNQVYVKLRHPRSRGNLENKTVSTENESIGVGEDDPFQELYRGSKSLRNSELIHQDGRKSLRRSKIIESKTLERKKKKHRLSSKSKSEKSLNEPITIAQPPLSQGTTPSTMMTTTTTTITLSKVISTSPTTSTIINSTNGNCDYIINNEDQSSSSEINKSPNICFDENKEWAEIASIMASFGNDLTQSTDEYSCNPKNEPELPTNHGNNYEMLDDWLKELHLTNYVNLLISNGFDNIQFMGPNILEEGDLIEIGITNPTDRARLLDASRTIPLIPKLAINENLSVDQWLSSLGLDEYQSNFTENGFTDMDKVRKIWDVELNAVIGVTKIGHRKRILASLGERLSLISDLSIDDLNFNRLNFDLDDLRINNEIDFRDEIGLPSDSFRSDDNFVYNSQTGGRSGLDIAIGGSGGGGGGGDCGSISFDYESDRTSISSDIRPDSVNSVMTTYSNRSSNIQLNTPLLSQWKHDPIELFHGECRYQATYLGSTLVTKLQGVQSTKESITKLKESTKDIKKIPTVNLSISYTGVKFIDAQTDKMVCEHEIRNIHCACQDADDFKHFAYITKEHETNNHYCHVFCATSLETVSEIILTLGQAFDIAYKIALGEDIETLRKLYHENQNKAPSPPPRSTSYSLSQCTSWDESSTYTQIPSSSGEETSTLKQTLSPKSQTNCLNNNNNNNSNNTNTFSGNHNHKNILSASASYKETQPDLILCSPSPTHHHHNHHHSNNSNSNNSNTSNTSRPPSSSKRPHLRVKPDVPTKPPSLIKSMASPASTLQRKSK